MVNMSGLKTVKSYCSQIAYDALIVSDYQHIRIEKNLSRLFTAEEPLSIIQDYIPVEIGVCLWHGMAWHGMMLDQINYY
jgi:hypothetical protein